MNARVKVAMQAYADRLLTALANDEKLDTKEFHYLWFDCVCPYFKDPGEAQEAFEAEFPIFKQ